MQENPYNFLMHDTDNSGKLYTTQNVNIETTVYRFSCICTLYPDDIYITKTYSYNTVGLLAHQYIHTSHQMPSAYTRRQNTNV